MRRSALDRNVVPVLRQAYKANMTQEASATRASVYEVKPLEEIDNGMTNGDNKLSSSFDARSKHAPGISSLFNGDIHLCFTQISL